MRGSQQLSQFTKTHTQIHDLHWKDIHRELDTVGYARIQNFLDIEACNSLKNSYTSDALYRSTIKMERYSFGRGEYRYYDYPLPSIINELRRNLFPYLVDIANSWNLRLKNKEYFPSNHLDYINDCHENGQTRPTPLILKYKENDFNCLHQDLYGEIVFPLQAAILLDEPSVDFDGGEFILTEQRPRMQSRVEVVPLNMGDMVIFPVNERPIEGTRSNYRVKMRHGVSRVRSGNRHTLGIIFHDAK